MEEKLAPLRVELSGRVPRRINLLIPELHRGSLYGGYIAKLKLAERLLGMGYRLRLVIVDPGSVSAAQLRDAVRGSRLLSGLLDRVELDYLGDRRKPLIVTRQDRFIATTWWTAHLAAEAGQRADGAPFVYLIQEYEPFTYPMGSWFAMAHDSYRYMHHALFSSALLRDFFAREQIGVFAPPGMTTGIAAFENAIVSFPSNVLEQGLQASSERLQRGAGRLLFYARPEAHASRNMFEVGFLGLSKALEDGVLDGRWELHGIGSERPDLPLPRGQTLKMIGKLGLDDYQRALLEYDIGLSLMYTPHPSLLPLEMAAAGQLVVTTTCLNKDAHRLRALSPNLIGASPSIAGICSGLRCAIDRLSALEARRDGACVDWASSWDEAFNPSLMSDLAAWLA